MRMLVLCTALSLTLDGSAFASDGCRSAGCGPKSDCHGGCTATPKKVDIKKPCFKVTLKKICIPPTRFPWDPSPCDSILGRNGQCGDKGECGAHCGPAAAAPCAAAGQCGAGTCNDGGLVSRLRDLLGMSNRGICRTIKYPEKSSVKVGETCVCTWKCDDQSDPNIRKGGCAPACAAPAAPATQEAPPAEPPGPAPPEKAARVLLRQLR